jgi:alkanesulfonate monooxygenase SsuD/methylene tetrahydromethanopterin reductase-like flavin-dependent oxidoreductase (luciferase family)
VKLGVLLPTFRDGATDALARADEAAAAGLDGVFAYDHLWPMGSPERPSLAPFALLSVIARRHHGLVVGPLVARVSLVDTQHLVRQFLTLHTLAPGRVIAAMGTGDKLSAPENEAYGLPALSGDVRRELLANAASALSETMPIWIGAGSDATNSLARELGATINLWDWAAPRVATMSDTGPVCWAGPAKDDLPATLSALSDAGATWSVFAPDVSISQLREWRLRQ